MDAVKVEDLAEPPVVGCYYMVPCVRSIVTGLIGRRGMRRGAYRRWLPVIGPKHDDREVIGFTEVHYHYDVRFLPDVVLNAIAGPGAGREVRALGMVRRAHSVGPEHRRCRCLRRCPEFPHSRFPPEHAGGGGCDFSWMADLERAYADARLKCGLACPHRGLPLAGQPVQPGDLVVCPGHGLRWNVKTGALAPRVVNP